MTENTVEILQNLTIDDTRSKELQELASFLKEDNQGNVDEDIKKFFSRELSHYDDLAIAGNTIIQALLNRINEMSTSQLMTFSDRLESTKVEGFRALTEMLAAKAKSNSLISFNGDISSSRNITIQIEEPTSNNQKLLDERLYKRMRERYEN